MSEVYEKSLKLLKDITRQVFEPGEARVVLFGSRARGDHLKTSDIDLGIFPAAKMDSSKVSLLREKIENSNIPYKVDVLDLSQVSEQFAREALNEGVVIWKG